MDLQIMFDSIILAALLMAGILQVTTVSAATNDSSVLQPTVTQIIPYVSNGQLLVIGQIIIGLLITATIAIQLRNMKIGRLLIRDKTIMFAGFLTKEDYDRVVKEKGHLFKLVPESELKELNGHASGMKKESVIMPDPVDGHLKKEDNNFTD